MTQLEMAKQILAKIQIANAMKDNDKNGEYFTGAYWAYRDALEILGYEVVFNRETRAIEMREKN